MKKLFLGTAVLAMLALVGCKKEQSQLDFEAIEGIATVQGKVTYVQGAVEKDGIIIENNVIAKAGAEVLLSVAYKGYDSDAKGTKQFTTTTDSEGKYKFEIPVGSIAVASTEVTVEVLPFKATKGEIVDGKVANVENAVFDQISYLDGKSKNVSLENKKVEVRNMEISTKDGLDKTVLSGAKKFTVSGKAYVQGEAWKDKDDASKLNIAKNLRLKGGVTMNIKLEYTATGDKEDKRVITYAIQSKAAADEDAISYSQEVSFFDVWDWDKVKVTVSTEAYYAKEEFTHLFVLSDATDVKKTQQLAGVFEKADANKTVSGKIVAETGLTIDLPAMQFTPDQQAVSGVNKHKKDDSVNFQSIDVYNWVSGGKLTSID